MSETNGKATLNTASTVIGTGVVVVGGLWFLAITPLKQDNANLKTQVDRLEARLSLHESLEMHAGASKSISEIRVQFGEVETQFKSLSQRVNSRSESQDRMICQLWEKAFGIHLEPLNYWPEVGTR